MDSLPQILATSGVSSQVLATAGMSSEVLAATGAGSQALAASGIAAQIMAATGASTPTLTASAAGIALLAMLLVWRARLRMPVAIKPVCCADPKEEIPLPSKTLLRRILQALDYLRTRREWRYRSPWVLLLGEARAGKSSLLASLPAEYKLPASGRQKELLIDGCNWQFVNNGALLDPPGNWPFAAASSDDSKDARAWKNMLDQLDALRPERALDGLLLTVSATTLQQASLEQRQTLAENLRQQLRTIQERLEFTLPVYVVVTACDSVEGFSAFWRSQPSQRQTEIFGWSATTQTDNGLPAEWADAAFSIIGEQLKALQVDSAANCERIQACDVDQFFLFPRHFQQLQVPFSHWIETVFQPSAWQAGFFCRGIYFTGHVAATGNDAPPQETARNDVSFVSDLLLKKVLAEPRLGRPTRQAIWSRNHLLRSLQLGAVAALACLLAGLLVSAWLVDHRVDAVISSLRQMQALQQPAASDSTSSCLPQAAVYQTLEQIAGIDANTAHVWIPVSLFDHRLLQKSARRLAGSAMANVVIPGIACQLRHRAGELPDAGDSTNSTADSFPRALASLYQTIDQTAELERNRINFENLLGNPPYSQGQLPLDQFLALLEYAYASPLPASVKSSPSLLPAVLQAGSYHTSLNLPANFRQEISAGISRQAQQVHTLLGQEIASGTPLLGKLEQLQEPVLNNTRAFAQWLNWVRKSWLGSNSKNNPYQQTHDELDSKLTPLIRQYGYTDPVLQDAIKLFSSNAEYQHAMNTLGNLQLASYGPLFTSQKGALELNPKLNAELQGINALMTLDFMQISDTQALVCRSKVSNWNIAQVTMASNYAQEYDAFVQKQGLPTLGKDSNPAARPLYDQLARHQLELVMNNSLALSQTSAWDNAAAQQTGLDFTSPADVRAAQQSAQFNKLLQTLLNVQAAYQNNNFSSADNLGLCISNDATDSLGNIQLLVDQSQLYQPANNPASYENRSADFFELGNAAMIKDMLAQQLARVTVLTGYATPYLSYLNNSGVLPAIPQRPNTETAKYWNNTINEINQYAQAKDLTRQVGLLENMFIKLLPGMNGENCNDLIDGNTSADYGNDLFSLHRKQLQDQIELRCESARSSQAYTEYNNWASRFNHDLAGHYPFGSNDSGDDADLVSTQNFFTDYAAAATVLHKKLAVLNGAYWDKARSFLDQLDAVVKFFNGNLVASSSNKTAASAGSNDAAPAIKLSVQFHAQPNNSPGSEQIVNWQLESGAQSIGFPNRPTTLDWPYGQALTVDFEWANHSPLKPLADGQPGLQVEGWLASFNAKGNWALLRLLQRHTPDTGKTADPQAPQSLLLQFNVAESNTSTANNPSRQLAKLYLSIGLSNPQNQAVLKLPAVFPTLAPQ